MTLSIADSVQAKRIEDDFNWFAARPKRTWRIRPLIPGEEFNLHNPPMPDAAPWTIIKRLRSGAFARLFGVIPAWLTPRDTDRDIQITYAAWAAAGGDFCLVDVDRRSDLSKRLSVFTRKAANAGTADQDILARVRHMIGGGDSVATVMA